MHPRVLVEIQDSRKLQRDKLRQVLLPDNIPLLMKTSHLTFTESNQLTNKQDDEHLQDIENSVMFCQSEENPFD